MPRRWASFSPINPFQVGIAQKVAKLELLSGWEFRLAVLVPALAVWIGGTMLYARRTRGPVAVGPGPAFAATGTGAGSRHAAVLATVLLAFALPVLGVLVGLAGAALATAVAVGV